LVGRVRDLILRHYPDIRLEGLRKITKPLNEDSPSLGGRDLNPEPSEHKSGVLRVRRKKFVLEREEMWDKQNCLMGTSQLAVAIQYI
jgi:hypothetical protein